MWEELVCFYTKGVYILCSVQCTSLVHWSHCYWIFLFFFPTSANCKQTSQTVLIKMWCRSSSRNPLACTLCHSGNLTRMFHYHSECTHRTFCLFFLHLLHTRTLRISSISFKVIAVWSAAGASWSWNSKWHQRCRISGNRNPPLRLRWKKVNWVSSQPFPVAQ